MLNFILAAALTSPLLNNTFEMENVDDFFKEPTYSYSGCVQLEYDTDKEGMASELRVIADHPEGMFTDQALKQARYLTTPKPNLTNQRIILEYGGENSWPKPFECLTEKLKQMRLEDIETQFLANESQQEMKDAIDKQVFSSIVDNFTLSAGNARLEENEDGTYNVRISAAWDTDIAEANNFMKHFFTMSYGHAPGLQKKALVITRGKNNPDLDNQSWNEDILNYIGQRRIEIHVQMNEHEKRLVIGAPVSGKEMCVGEVGQTTSFENYCFTFANPKGTDIVFTNIPASEAEDKDFRIKSAIKIRNTYLKMDN